MDLPPRLGGLGNLSQEADEFIAGMSSGCFAQHLACLDIQSSIEPERSMAGILESMPLRSGPAITAALDRAGPKLGLPSFHPRRTRPHAGADSSTTRSRPPPWFQSPDHRWPCIFRDDGATRRIILIEILEQGDEFPAAMSPLHPRRDVAFM